MNPIQIIFYPEGGSGPVKDRLEMLSQERPKAWRRLVLDLEILGAEGLRSRQVTLRPMGEGLWELKRNYDGIHYRIFFCLDSGRIWLLHSFEKKQAKTPLNEIRLARKRRREVMS